MKFNYFDILFNFDVYIIKSEMDNIILNARGSKIVVKKDSLLVSKSAVLKTFCETPMKFETEFFLDYRKLTVHNMIDYLNGTAKYSADIESLMDFLSIKNDVKNFEYVIREKLAKRIDELKLSRNTKTKCHEYAEILYNEILLYSQPIMIKIEIVVSDFVINPVSGIVLTVWDDRLNVIILFQYGEDFYVKFNENRFVKIHDDIAKTIQQQPTIDVSILAGVQKEIIKFYKCLHQTLNLNINDNIITLIGLKINTNNLITFGDIINIRTIMFKKEKLRNNILTNYTY